MDLHQRVDEWLQRYDSLPIVGEMLPNGNFVYELFGVKVGFSFGCAGQAYQFYWLESLNVGRFITDGKFVSQEKLNNLIGKVDEDFGI